MPRIWRSALKGCFTRLKCKSWCKEEEKMQHIGDRNTVYPKWQAPNYKSALWGIGRTLRCCSALWDISEQGIIYTMLSDIKTKSMLNSAQEVTTLGLGMQKEILF